MSLVLAAGATSLAVRLRAVPLAKYTVIRKPPPRPMD